MKPISTKTHGIMDLLYSATFLAAPLLLKALGNSEKRGRKKAAGIHPETIVLPSIGAGILAQGLITDHEVGAVKALSVPAHLNMDLGISAFIMAAPWLFNMDRRTRIPMLALGAAGLGLALLTRRRSGFAEPEEAFHEAGAVLEELA